MNTSFTNSAAQSPVTSQQYADAWAAQVVELFIQEIYQGARQPKAPNISTPEGITAFRATLSGSQNILNTARPAKLIVADIEDVMPLVINKLIDRQDDLEKAIVEGQKVYRSERGMKPLELTEQVA